MKTIVTNKEFEINVTPLEKITADAYSIDVELDDIHEERYSVSIEPFQAMKIVTIDCVSSKEYYNEYCFRDGLYHRHILEVEESNWIAQLKKDLVDESATFLDNVKHFVLPLQDIVVEFVAQDIQIKKL